MLKDSLQIIRIDGRNCFVDISASAFDLGEGKVVLQFRNYDIKKPKGQRFQNSIDFYMDIIEFAYFCENLKSGRFAKKILCQKVEEGKFAEPVYKKLGGTERNGKIISRQLILNKGMKTPFVLQAFQGEGKKDKANRLFVPNYTYATATDKVNIAMDAEAMMKIGLAGESAIRIFDIWTANGVLDEKIKALKNKYSKDTPCPSNNEDTLQGSSTDNNDKYSDF